MSVGWGVPNGHAFHRFHGHGHGQGTTRGCVGKTGAPTSNAGEIAQMSPQYRVQRPRAYAGWLEGEACVVLA